MKFDKTRFTYSGGYLHYDGKFIARFKYRRAPVTMAKFKAVLMKYYTVEGYLDRLANFGNTPMGILTEDGYLKIQLVNGVREIVLDGKVLS